MTGTYQIHSELRAGHWVAWVTGTSETKPSRCQFTRLRMTPGASASVSSCGGRRLVEDQVRAWLPGQVDSVRSRRELTDSIQKRCLDHIPAASDRRDMSSHETALGRGLNMLEIVDELCRPSPRA